MRPAPERAFDVHDASTRRVGAISSLVDTVVDLWQRRDLVRQLVRRELGRSSANTLLGNLWWILDPLLQLAIYLLLVGVLFERALPDYALFVFAALLPWKWFSSSIMASLGSVVGRERIIRQVPFPKIVLPVSGILVHTVHLGFGLAILLVAMVTLFPYRISTALLWVPLVVVVQLILTLAVGVMLSAINVFYRDLTNLMRHALRLGFYLSPVLYGASLVEEKVHSESLVLLYRLNPFVTLLESYRSAIYYGRAPELLQLYAVLIASIFVLLAALVLFRRAEPTFAKVL